MRKGQLFTDFYTKFLHLAGTAEIPVDDYLDDLTDKITFTLQEALLPTQGSHQTYQQLAEHLTGLDQNQRRIQQQRDRIVARTQKPSPDRTSRPTRQLTGQLTDRQPAATGPQIYRPPLTNDQQQLFREGKCFYCKIAGHRALECPEKKKADVQVIEQGEQSGNDEP